MAPQIDEFTEIFLPNVSKFGFSFEFEVVKKGFFPKGGGLVNFYLKPVSRLEPVNMVDVGRVTEVQGWKMPQEGLQAVAVVGVPELHWTKDGLAAPRGRRPGTGRWATGSTPGCSAGP